MKFQKYDMVKLKLDFDSNLKKGMRGAVLMVFESDPTDYEVEFIDDQGESISVVTISEKFLELDISAKKD